MSFSIDVSFYRMMLKFMSVSRRFDTGFNSYSNYGKTNLFRRITAHQLSEERQEKFHKFKKFEHPEATLAKMKVLS